MARGGKREGAGRPAGTPSAVTKQAKATLSELARAHAPAALQTLVEVMQTADSAPARVAAANALLDRGYGKPAQAVEVSGDGGGPMRMLVENVVVASTRSD